MIDSEDFLFDGLEDEEQTRKESTISDTPYDILDGPEKEEEHKSFQNLNNPFSRQTKFIDPDFVC